MKFLDGILNESKKASYLKNINKQVKRLERVIFNLGQNPSFQVRPFFANMMDPPWSGNKMRAFLQGAGIFFLNGDLRQNSPFTEEFLPFVLVCGSIKWCWMSHIPRKAVKWWVKDSNYWVNIWHAESFFSSPTETLFSWPINFTSICKLIEIHVKTKLAASW